MTRVLFFGDLGPTGFGTVTRDLGRALLNTGLDVRFLSHYGMPDGPLEEPFASRTLTLSSFVMGPDGGVQDIQQEAIRGVFKGRTIAGLANGEPWGDWKPEVAIILGDFLAVRLFMQPLKDEFSGLPTFHYVPIEGVGLPPKWAEIWKVAKPVAMCQFGADQIERVTGERPAVAYHGVDSDVFRPVAKRKPLILKAENTRPNFLTSRDECKAAWVNFLAEQNNVPKVPRHWMLRTDRHMPRKRYNALLRSVMPVLSRHPDWALVIHCQPWDQGGNLIDELSKYPESVRAQVLLTGISGLDRTLLVSLYNAADLYVSNSAEGFGLTIAEALACGVPAVGVGYSSVPEVIGPAGAIVREGGLIDNEYDHFWWGADETMFTRAVEYLVTHQMRREELGRRGPVHIARNFTWAAAASVFADLVQAAVPSEVAA